MQRGLPSTRRGEACYTGVEVKTTLANWPVPISMVLFQCHLFISDITDPAGESLVFWPTGGTVILEQHFGLELKPKGCVNFYISDPLNVP